ncbi:MAG: 4-hydroxythreonine-4-phosphate dehydrogenase [Vampirovibrio sp.]|jgi:4-hydroxythreonine-4-phosphate dehydrogenase|nr:4-hydroxythreonine-4-phosphate dehydrogenase [Vampirovibrio sp.]
MHNPVQKPASEPLQAKSTFCLTIGDPTGIGPEITAKFLQQATLQTSHHSLIIFGDIPNLIQTAEQLGLELPEGPQFRYENLQTLGSPLKAPGQIAYESIEAAVAEIHQRKAQALITGPISKEHLQASGIPFSGHTEILQQLARSYYQHPYQSDMLFLYRQFRMLLLTRHVPLRKVSETLSIKGVARSLDNLASFFRNQCGINSPRLCILGVNPHAGELEGEEEERILKPALKLISEKYGFGIEPPVAADAAFRHFHVDRLPYDAYVAAYHDQGLIPFKMVAGLNAVNVTIGLPFLRTSVSHGTAPDIAGQGIADPGSLIEAYQTAVRLSRPLETSLAPEHLDALVP